jgi:hypothetical protein
MLRRGSALVLAVTISFAASSALAQDAPVEEPQPPAAVDPGDPAWTIYHAAFAALAKGNTKGAKAMLEELANRYPDHPLAVRALETLALLGGSQATTLGFAPTDRPPVDLRTEEKSKTARAELALVQTFHGIAVGVEFCLITECDEAAPIVGMILLGASAGVGGSLLATREGITPGQRATANSGTMWGAWNGALILSLQAGGDEETDVQSAALVMLGSQAAGLAAGITAGQTLRPTEGQVSLANTVGIWTGVMTLFADQTFEIDFDSRELVTALLLTTDAAFVAGAYLAKREPMSRGRTLVIDAGGIVGMLAGFGIVTLIQGEGADSTLLFGSAMAGTAVGLASATWFTRRWDF